MDKQSFTYTHAQDLTPFLSKDDHEDEDKNFHHNPQTPRGLAAERSGAANPRRVNSLVRLP